MELLALTTLILVLVTKNQTSLKMLLPGLYLAAMTMFLDILNAWNIADQFGRSAIATASGSWAVPIYWLLLLSITVLQVIIYIRGRRVRR
jgi:hypothetical protein